MKSNNTALITGITGQDGAYLAKLLIDRGYKVYGTYRKASTTNYWRLNYLNIYEHKQLELVPIELVDPMSVYNVINGIRPNEIYNLAAQSFVGISFEQPFTTTSINSLGTLNILEAIKLVDKSIKFYQASTSEMFGKVTEVPQSELTPFHPRSPYGVSKLYSHWITKNYRESYDMFCSCGILFNHESPLRGMEFVTRKITHSIAQIALGIIDEFSLGNIYAKRDWGYAADYVEGMWKILNHDKPDDFILSTGKTYNVKEFLTYAFNEAGIEIKFEGNGLEEVGYNNQTSKQILTINEKFYRPAEVDLLIGNPEKAKSELGWEAKTNMYDLCKLMVKADFKRNKNI